MQWHDINFDVAERCLSLALREHCRGHRHLHDLHLFPSFANAAKAAAVRGRELSSTSSITCIARCKVREEMASSALLEVSWGPGEWDGRVGKSLILSRGQLVEPQSRLSCVWEWRMYLERCSEVAEAADSIRRAVPNPSVSMMHR